MHVSDFDYHLPEHLIAKHPLASRSASKLLHLPAGQAPQDKLFTELPSILQKGDLIVFNDTKVMKARVFGNKSTGGAIEMLVERVVTPTSAHCHIRASKAPKPGTVLHMANGAFTATVTGRKENLFVVDFDSKILPMLEQHGELPIPPYFEREADTNDNERYQTVFHDPEKLASVAAPTASLHFDDATLAKLSEQGIEHAFVTLHVGAGTFAPVKTDNILEHTMHSEYGELPKEVAEKINHVKQNCGKVIAVGTTVTRVLETAALGKPAHAPLEPWYGDTDIFIYPGFEFKVIDRLVTNFHLPKSTLLMLVSAFAGKEQMHKAYEHAISQEYRFFSYGDAMLLEKNQ